MSPFLRSLTFPILATALLVSAGTGALAQTVLPDELRQGDVVYRTGGVTMDEAAAFKAIAGRYSLVLELAEGRQPNAVYLYDIPVTIFDAAGRQMLATRSDGPFVMVQLPPGRYRVAATHMGVARTREVQVSGGASQHVVLLW